MIWQRETLGLSLKKVASNLGVDPSTVSRVVSLFWATGSVQKRPYPKDARPNIKLTKPVQLTILHTVLQYSGIYLREFQTKVYVLTGVIISVPSLCTFLHKSNITYQRMQIVAKQSDRERCVYESHMLVFVNETESDCRDALRKYGYGVSVGDPQDPVGC